MSVHSFDDLVYHAGHSCIVQTYIDPVDGNIVNVSIECVECQSVLVSYDEGEDDYATKEE
jgi:hypothetical protein